MIDRYLAKPERAWLKPLVAPLRPHLRELLLFALVINLLALAAPVFVLQVYDRVVFHGGLETLKGLVVGMAVVLVVVLVLREVRARLMQTIGLRLDVQLSRALFQRLTDLPLASLEAKPIGMWQGLFRDADTVRNVLSGATAVLLLDLPFVLLFMGLILVIAAPIFPVVMGALVVFGLLAWRSGQVVSEATTQEKAAAAHRDAFLAEMIAGRTTLKALTLKDMIHPMWEERQAAVTAESLQRGKRADRYSALAVEFTMATTVLMTTVGALAILDQRMTIGALVAANMMSSRLLGPLNQLVSVWRQLTQFHEATARLGTLFDEPTDRPRSAVTLDRPKGLLEAESLVFRYGQQTNPVIDGAALRLGPGGMTALLGPNGSGKTTLMKLLMGLYRPEAGRVLLDGMDMAQFSREELARWIGVMPQESVLLSTSIRDNIAAGHAGAEDAQVVAAAKLAGVHDMIVDLPDGYATHVGEAGQRLSGGMRQRLAVARALVGDPPLILLDEPSSHLDRLAEETLARTLRSLAKDHTVLLVTHAPVLLSTCDRVVVLERGHVTRTGTPAEVLGQRPAQPPQPMATAQASSLTTLRPTHVGPLKPSGTDRP